MWEAVIFDLPEVIPLAEEQIQRRGLSRRVRTAPGDYLRDELSGDNDLVLLSNIIHSLAPEENLELLRKINRAILPGGRLVLKDFILDEDRTGPLFATLFAINMLVSVPDGDTYTLEEITDWLVRAGFEPGERFALARHSSVIIARK